MPCEVRSPGQVKWPNYKITFQSRHGYNVSGKVMKLSEYDELISAYKTYISDFWYRWPQVRSFLRPPHYKSMGKNSTPLYLLWRKPIWVESYRIGQLWTIRVQICIAYPSKGQLRSAEVTNRHLPISFANNFWSKRDRDVGLVSVRSSWPGESNDMQYDPFRSSRDLGQTWPEVKLWPWPFKVILYMVRRALTFALVGGSFWPPLWFFEDNSKTKGSSVTKLGIPFYWSILHLLWNFCVGVTSGQVTRSSHVT